MHARAKIFGHPIHQMLIVFPLGLLATSVIFDIIYFATKNGAFATVSFWLIAAGVVGGLVAAPFGLVDWLGIPANTRAKSIGALHGIGNVVVVLFFAVSWFMRRDDVANPAVIEFVLSIIGAGIALFTGWLGGELVDRLGVGVDEGAHVDAPSSLSDRPVTEHAHARETVHR